MAKTDVGHTAAVTFHLTIDYTQSLAEMVAAGNYDHVDRDITDENFSVGEGVAEVEAILVDLDRPTTTEGVLAGLDHQGLRPAAMPELLAFGAQYPEVQRIVALGSVLTLPCGSCLVGDLWADPGYRVLGLTWYNGGWSEGDRFLAFPK